MTADPRARLIVALDVPAADDARRLLDALAGQVGLFKVGHQLFTAAGPELVREIVARGERVFLDLKYHDIPNTVGAALAAAAALGVSLANVHALGGTPMIAAAARSKGATRLLAVTLLTSHDEAALLEIGLSGGAAAHVPRLARLAQRAGADGVVASPLEVAAIRQACGPDFLVVTPGIRPEGASRGDQARASTPAAAVAAGADYIVVGRPILSAPDPAAAARAIVDELAGAL